MASKFKILRQKTCNSIQLTLMGDFDGSSAFELLKAIKEKGGNKTGVFINTDGLEKIHEFGCDLFHSIISTLNTKPVNLIFTGKNKLQV